MRRLYVCSHPRKLGRVLPRGTDNSVNVVNVTSEEVFASLRQEITAHVSLDQRAWMLFGRVTLPVARFRRAMDIATAGRTSQDRRKDIPAKPRSLRCVAPSAGSSPVAHRATSPSARPSRRRASALSMSSFGARSTLGIEALRTGGARLISRWELPITPIAHPTVTRSAALP
jgi:hypothetical protein